MGKIKPINTAEQPFFVNVLHKFKPQYCVPGRTFLTKKLIPIAHREMSTKLQKLILQCSYVSFTTDIWTSNYSMDSFIGLTGHFITSQFERHTCVLRCQHFPNSHSGENITAIIKKITSDYKIKPHKMFTCVSDNASNMINGTNNAGLTHLGCFLHILHLIITNCIFCQPGVEALIKKCKNIVTAFKKSSTEKHLFESIELEEEKDTSGYRLHQLIAIRWNSIYYMLNNSTNFRNDYSCIFISQIKLKNLPNQNG